MENKIIKITEERKIKIKESVFEVFLTFIQNESRLSEAGGILIGTNIINTEHILIDYATIPQKNDIRSKFQFVRKEKKHLEILEKIRKQFEYKRYYLGEWHTHPEKDPNPSDIDFKNWKKLLETTKSYGNYLYFIIVGTNFIGIWEGNRKKITISKIANIQL